jgi:site-specific recombinase XerD
MDITNSIINYRRFLKRRNYSLQTVKSYLNSLRQFILWIDAPIEQVTHKKIEEYIDFMLDKRLKPKTINCHLQSIRSFYQYLYQEDELKIPNPVKTGYCLRLPRPLPRHLNDDDVDLLFNIIKKSRDRAMFKLMLRCGLRVEEVANLTRDAVDLKRRKILVYHGKGGKGRVVYISDDACNTLARYLKSRSSSKLQKVFLVEKGTYKGKPISIRGIQKRIEYYAKKTGLKVSCHNLRHTMATQMLNADAELSTIQDLLGHNWITTTQRYCTISNLKVQRDYFKAMDVVMLKTANALPGMKNS